MSFFKFKLCEKWLIYTLDKWNVTLHFAFKLFRNVSLVKMLMYSLGKKQVCFLSAILLILNMNAIKMQIHTFLKISFLIFSCLPTWILLFSTTDMCEERRQIIKESVMKKITAYIVTQIASVPCPLSTIQHIHLIYSR